ncbi:glyceraldehyde-3-phosphate dehydrogenase [Vannielia litorea]|nr:glyceraldehyde-3-phosphate dehydrogenase [Vannielia litorea]MBS8228844.1 glyceraldehyde-3-phosphate dehydrogenase [Vannielia litorea]
MTNRLAIILFVLILALLVADGTLNDGAATLFMLKKFAKLTEWMAFWR